MQVVDYEATMAAKLSISKKIFDAEKDAIAASTSFQKFFAENKVFRVLMVLSLFSSCHFLC